jgi:hypothetical protein
MVTATSFTRELKEDPDFPGEFMLDLGDELVNQLGWKVGDTVVWTDNQDGTWTLKKKTAGK